MLVEVHHCDNEDEVLSGLVQDPVRKPVRPTPAGTFGEGRPGLRMLNDAADRSLDLCGQFKSEAFTLGIVVRDRFSEFVLRRVEELDSHASRWRST